MQRRRAWIVIGLLLLVIGGVALRWVEERKKVNDLTGGPLPVAAASAVKEGKSRSREPRGPHAEGLAKVRKKLERIRVAEFRLKRASVRTATYHLREILLQGDPGSWVTVMATGGAEVPKLLRTNEDERRGGRLNWPVCDYELGDVSAWEVVERLADDYAMRITEKGGVIVLVPDGKVGQ